MATKPTQIDGATASLLRSAGINPDTLPPGTLINGKPLGESVESKGQTKPSGSVMNKTEAKYAEQLEAMKRDGHIVAWWFEPFSLKLAEKVHYRPDFLVQWANGTLEIVEVKGFWRDDALVKYKVAREKFPCFQWSAVRKSRKGWEPAI